MVDWNLGRAREKHPNQTMKLTHNLYFTNKSYALENVIRLEGYSPSPLNAKPANPYLILRANSLPAARVTSRTFTSYSSAVGSSLIKNGQIRNLEDFSSLGVFHQEGKSEK